MVVEDTSNDENPKTRPFNTNRHKRTTREVKPPVVKRYVGVKRIPRFYSKLRSQTSQKMNNNPVLSLKVRRIYGLTFGFLDVIRIELRTSKVVNL